MSRLAEILERKSAELNLFSIGDRLRLNEKHIPDAEAVLSFWKAKPGFKALDIGTGGGLPGLALAIARPDMDWTLMDATEKKIRAVSGMAQELELKNVRGQVGRLEALAHWPEFREQFDVATARAVATLPTLLEYASGVLKVGGFFYAWKSRDFVKELETSGVAQEVLHLQYAGHYDYVLPTGERRSILEFEKKAPLPPTYPRGMSIPKMKPLI